jgi:hypothetical protein
MRIKLNDCDDGQELGTYDVAVESIEQFINLMNEYKDGEVADQYGTNTDDFMTFLNGKGIEAIRVAFDIDKEVSF